jgi:hypothetical protein
MANRAAWVAGLGQGYTWGQLFSSSAATDINNASGIATGSCVLSTITVANQGSQDVFMDISARFAIASNTIAAGANLAFYLYGLLDDGSTYGSGELTAGTVATTAPPIPAFATIPLRAAASQTLLTGYVQGLIIPPGSFKMVFQNNSGFTTNATGNVCMYRTYLLNLNA